jgi:hypothetical protein
MKWTPESPSYQPAGLSVTRRQFLKGAAFAAAAAAAATAARVVSGQQVGGPPGPSGPISMKSDRPTLLMGDEAVITGGPKPQSVGHGAKRLQVGNWTSAEDSFTWQVDVLSSDEFLVTALTKSKGAVLELKAGSQKLERAVETNWDCIEMGRLRLDKGVHSLTLRATKPGGRMEFYSLELVSPALERQLGQQAKEVRSDTAWMRKAKYGLQFHWTSTSMPHRGPRKNYRDATRDFPAETFAQIVKDSGAGYAIVATSNAQHYFPAPIKAIDRVLPGRTAERDLVRDWIDALGAHGIRLILYYHCGHDDWRNPDGWWRHTGYDPKNPQKFLDNWCAITSEVGNRYGKGLAGWYFDDACVYYPLNPDFRRLTLAAKAGNPDRVVCYNPWILPRSTDFQDYLCGEGYQFLKAWDGLPADGTGIYTSGPYKGLQAHTNFVLERGWVHSGLNTDIPAPQYKKEQFVQDMKAGIAHGIVPSVNMEIYQDGGVGEASLEFMKAVKQDLTGKG